MVNWTEEDIHDLLHAAAEVQCSVEKFIQIIDDKYKKIEESLDKPKKV